MKIKMVVLNFNQFREDSKNHKIEEVGAKLREMMPWMKKEAATKS